MAERKLLFFDIDNTLWDRDNNIPESTIRAIRKAREKGHLCFICTGRTRGNVRIQSLFDIGFDGVVCGCGTMVELQKAPDLPLRGDTLGNIPFYYSIPASQMADTVTICRKYGLRPILEGRDFLYMDHSDFGDDPYGKKLIRELGPRLKTIKDEWGRWEASKLSCASDHADREACFAALGDRYHFIIHNSAIVEIVPKGFDKGTGVRKVCELLGASVSDTVAFGDSVNDLEMLTAAGLGVVMGNGDERAKAVAGFITRSLFEDGIEYACRELGLI